MKWKPMKVGTGMEMPANCPLDADRSPGNELVQFLIVIS
jgi:hypothetical protein